MNKAAIVCIILISAPSATARTITVDDDPPADFTTIQAAINDANNGDTVEIRPGTYTGEGNRDIDFLAKAITVRSTEPNDPNIVAATIIDCNASQFDEHWGLYIHDNNENLSTIAGLTISNTFVVGADGGAIRCENSMVSIRNCTATGNEAVMYCNIIGCWGGYGAAISCTDSNALIAGCTIANNAGESAVGFFRSTGLVIACTLEENDATAIHSYKSTLQISNCTFRANQAYIGAALTAYEGSVVSIDNCLMEDNHASDSGGSILVGSGSRWDEACTVTISNSVLTENSSVGHRQGGAIMCCGNHSLNLIDSELTGNYTNHNGGAVYCNGELTVSGCTITGNRADDGGGGIGLQCSATITNSFIADNTAEYGGGGIEAGGLYESLTITNCVIAYNQAGKYGGGLHFYSFDDRPSDATVTNSTFLRNIAEQYGGGISVWNENANLALTNSILWANTDSTPPGQSQQIYDVSTVDPPITYSCIQDWDEGGTGNITDDPRLDQDDYHLLPPSPCINAGNPNYAPATAQEDIDGEARVMDGRVDIGADEVGPKQADLSRDGLVNFEDYSILIQSFDTSPSDPNWYALSDLYEDNRINYNDLATLIDDWLWRAPWHK